MGKEETGLRKILIVEDDKVLNKTLAYNLTADNLILLCWISICRMGTVCIYVMRSEEEDSIPILCLSPQMIKKAIC